MYTSFVKASETRRYATCSRDEVPIFVPILFAGFNLDNQSRFGLGEKNDKEKNTKQADMLKKCA